MNYGSHLVNSDKSFTILFSKLSSIATCQLKVNSIIVCDNGTNLTSAYSELQRTIQQLDKKAIDAYCIKHDMEGFFQPPTSSHTNGACERMIRTVRKVLTCMLTDYTTDIKTNMLHIHTSIVSSHLATRDNNKILRTPPPHISSYEDIFVRLTRSTRAQLRTKNNPSSNHTYTKSTPKHIHHHYAPFITLTYTKHIICSTAPILSPLDLWTDPAGVTVLLARWTEKLAGGPQAGRWDYHHKKGSRE